MRLVGTLFTKNQMHNLKEHYQMPETNLSNVDCSVYISQQFYIVPHYVDGLLNLEQFKTWFYTNKFPLPQYE